MNRLGQLNCSSDRRNTGFGSCVEDWKLIKGAFIYDEKRTFTADEIEALEATLQADAIADDKNDRCYPVHNFVQVTDNTEDVTIQTFDYGGKAIVREGDYDWLAQFTAGGNCLAQSLRTHNGPAYVLFYDKDKKILGTKDGALLSTIPTQFVHTMPWKLATGSTTAMYLIRFVFGSNYINEDRAFVKATFDPSEIVGMQDIEMVLNSFDEVTGVANVTLQTSCGGANVYDQYSTQLAATARYSAVDQDGNEVTVTAAVAVAASKSFDITLDATDFPSSGTVYLSGKAPSVLAAAGIEGYEIVTLELPIEGS